MDNIKRFYDSESNIYWIKLKDGIEDRVEQLAQGILVEFNADNEVIGIEISNASKHFETNISYKNYPDENRILPVPASVQPYIRTNVNIGSSSVGQPITQFVFE